MTCAHFGRDQICTQVKASFSPFGHPIQVEWRPLTYYISQWNTRYVCLEMFFLRLACTCEETCQFVWPPDASLYASSTYAQLRLLASPFDQGLTLWMPQNAKRNEYSPFLQRGDPSEGTSGQFTPWPFLPNKSQFTPLSNSLRSIQTLLRSLQKLLRSMT